MFADGSTQWLPVYHVNVIWDGQLQNVSVRALDCDPLLGTALLDGHDLRIRWVAGGDVTIEAVP